jgi:hypothetical protein
MSKIISTLIIGGVVLKKFKLLTIISVLSLGIFACSNQSEQVSSEHENAGFKEEKVIKSTGDVREVVWYQLSLEDKERIDGEWEEAKVSTITLKEHMMNFSEETLTYVGKEVFLVDFPTTDKNVKPNNIAVYADMETFNFIGYGFVD